MSMSAIVNSHNCVPYLALADGALGGMFIPGRAAKTCDAIFIHTGFGDVIVQRVCLAWVRNAAGAALTFRNRHKLAVCQWSTRHWPAVHLAVLQQKDMCTWVNITHTHTPV